MLGYGVILKNNAKKMNPISIINMSNSASQSGSKKPKASSAPGNQIHISSKQIASVELEVTHEVFFGENLKRVIRALCGK